MTKRRVYATLGLITLLMPIMAIFAVPVFAGKAGAMVLGATFHKLGLLGLAGTVDVLTTKNRAATELRQQAAALRAEIMNTTTPMTAEELKNKGDALAALEQRAAMVAGFTADEEITRQGGAGELQRVDNAEGDQAQRLTHKRSNMSERIAEFAERVKQEFGDVRSYLDIVISGKPGRQVTEGQKRVVEEAKTLTRAIVGTAGDVSGGEFVLPLTQVSQIFSLANVQQGMLQRARAYNVPGRTLRIPYLIQTDEAASTTLNRPMAGQLANITIVGEGSTKPTVTPKFGQRLLTVFKYAAITQASDEILGDDFTGELPQEFINAVGQQTLNKVNEDITFDGAGTTEPDGALKTGAAWTISQTRAGGANTITPPDVFGMYAKHTHGPNSVWLASRRTVQQIYNMSLTSASLVTFLKDLRGLPEMMILGYPVVLTDLLPTLGTAGDLALVNPDFYAFALRQALTVESSRDFAFTQDITTYRFVVRAGGIPINTGKYAYKYAGVAGIDEHSPFVYLT